MKQKDISKWVGFEKPPQNEQENNKIAAMLATGNYPAGLDGCFTTVQCGGCGVNCYVYKSGDCKHPEEFLENKLNEMTEQDIEYHKETYED